MFLFEPMASDMFNNTNPFLGSPSSTTGMSGNLFPPSPSYDGDIDMMNTLLAFDPSLDSCQPSTSSASVSVTAPMSMPVPQQQQHQQHQLQQQQPQFDYSQYVYPTTTQQAMMPMDAISASMTMPFAMPTTTSMPMQQATSMPMQFTPSMSPPFATYPYNATYPLLLQQPPTSPPNTGKAMLIPLPAEYPQPAVSMSVLDADGLSPTQRAKKEMAHSESLLLVVFVLVRMHLRAWTCVRSVFDASRLRQKDRWRRVSCLQACDGRVDMSTSNGCSTCL